MGDRCKKLQRAPNPSPNRLPLFISLSRRTDRENGPTIQGGDEITTHVDNRSPAIRLDHLQTFFERFNVHPLRYALQQPDGSYLARADAPTPLHFVHHLAGHWTLAVYAADETKNLSKWICLDSDQDDGFILLKALQFALYESLSWESLLESSRRGGHLWIFLDPDSYDRNQALRLTQAVCEVHYRSKLDRFPKESGMGGNVRLPLGIHRKTGLRYPVWNHREQRFSEGIPDALAYIASLGTVSTAQIIARYAS